MNRSIRNLTAMAALVVTGFMAGQVTPASARGLNGLFDDLKNGCASGFVRKSWAAGYQCQYSYLARCSNGKSPIEYNIKEIDKHRRKVVWVCNGGGNCPGRFKKVVWKQTYSCQLNYVVVCEHGWGLKEYDIDKLGFKRTIHWTCRDWKVKWGDKALR